MLPSLAHGSLWHSLQRSQPHHIPGFLVALFTHNFQLVVNSALTGLPKLLLTTLLWFHTRWQRATSPPRGAFLPPPSPAQGLSRDLPLLPAPHIQMGAMSLTAQLWRH